MRMKIHTCLDIPITVECSLKTINDWYKWSEMWMVDYVLIRFMISHVTSSRCGRCSHILGWGGGRDVRSYSPSGSQFPPTGRRQGAPIGDEGPWGKMSVEEKRFSSHPPPPSPPHTLRRPISCAFLVMNLPLRPCFFRRGKWAEGAYPYEKASLPLDWYFFCRITCLKVTFFI